MIRTDKFGISKGLYAVYLPSFDVNDVSESQHGDAGATYEATIMAAWFRRRGGVTRACIGNLWNIHRGMAPSAEQFLGQLDDGRYGAQCEGRWDGDRYWGAQEPEVVEEHLTLLRPMLDSYPAIPLGFDGWWRF